MSFTQIGVAPFSIPSGLKSFCAGAPPAYSYLYSSPTQQDYLFEDPEMDQVSFLPPFEINGKKVIFTFNRCLALYYDHSFIYSISDFLKKIQAPQCHNLKQDLLDKIATAANYLSQGEECQYIQGTAKLLDKGLQFLVRKGGNLCKATLSPFAEEKSNIDYQEVKVPGA